jgi:hypothetical protein
MTGGLLDFLHDPEVMARIEERRLLVEHVAGQLNISKQEAREYLDTADLAAIEAFSEGNVIPFRTRH